MQWTIPGTTLTGERENAAAVSDQFEALFLAGGLTLSQVASIAGLEPHVIQNWVKRKYLAPPTNKRYCMEQLCRILNINVLRGALPIEQVQNLMAYINGDLVDEGDDLVDDSMLYFYFVRLAARCRYLGGSESWDEAIRQVTADYREPVPGAKEKLTKVLNIMLTVWVTNALKAQVDKMMEPINKK